MTKLWISFALLFSGLLHAEGPIPRQNFQWRPVEVMAIQERGRIKPFETFAQESLLFITGKRSWKGMSAVEVLFGWLITYDKEWKDEPFIRVDYKPLKTELGIPVEPQYFTTAQLGESNRLIELVKSGMKKEERRERATELEKKALQLQQKRALLNSIVSGDAWAIFPNPQDINETWFPISSLGDPSAGLPYSMNQGQKLQEQLRPLLNAFLTQDSKAWNDSVVGFTYLLRSDLSGGRYPTIQSLERESWFNKFRPFRVAWILYLFGFIGMLVHLMTQTKWSRWFGLGSAVAAFLVHIYGFVLRSLISGRPPVTNMYESVIWVAFGCVLFSFLIYMAYRNLVIPTAAMVFAVVGLVLADNLPMALDPSIHPLEPVLRSNFWLTIHVLTITLSYAAFGLSLCLGNVVIGTYFLKPTATEVIQRYSLYMYRAVQIGVILVAAGTILGGVWADYSWGRFWGWDPKEVWALIVLLLYIAVLHGRFTGWLKGFGFAASCVFCFLGVLMAWYGVNFVLGVGLHSYGFGSGGVEYVLWYVGAQSLFVVIAYLRYAKYGPSEAPSIFPKA